MLVKRIWKPNSEWKRQKIEIIHFESCIKYLKYYFANIERVKCLLLDGQIIKTPYFELSIQDAIPSEEDKIHWHNAKALSQGRTKSFSPIM